LTSASNKNEFQKYFLGGKGGWCLGLIELPPSCADFLEMWRPRPPGSSRVFKGLNRDCLTLIIIINLVPGNRIMLWGRDFTFLCSSYFFFILFCMLCLSHTYGVCYSLLFVHSLGIWFSRCRHCATKNAHVC